MSLLSLWSLSACQLPTLHPPDADDDGDGPSAEETDSDRDGYPLAEDCDDDDAAVNPGVASDGCNEADDDCDGDVDEDANVSWYPDVDGDGYGDRNSEATVACAGPEGHVSNAGDCADDAATTWPGAPELCDSFDNDCDDTVDDDIVSDLPWYADRDGDGSGDAAVMVQDCVAPDGYVGNADDCDDRDGRSPAWVDDIDDGGAGTIAEPYSSIQNAIDTGASCVYVRDGTYYETLDFHGYSPWIVGLSGSGSTVVYGDETGPVMMLLSGESPVVEGFTLQNGGGYLASTEDASVTPIQQTDTWYGGGILSVGGSPAFTDVVVEGNHLPDYSSSDDGTVSRIVSSYGGGIMIIGGGPSFTDVMVYDNEAWQGGGVYVSSAEATLVRVDISGNLGERNTGLAVDYATVVAANLIMNANTAEGEYGGVALYSGKFVATNCTIVAHKHGIWVDGSSTLSLDSCILQSNTYGVGGEGMPSVWVQYTDVYSNAKDYDGVPDQSESNGNTSVSALFKSFRADADRTNDSLLLRSDSPLIDAGNPAPEYNDVDGTVNDMGAYGGPNGAW